MVATWLAEVDIDLIIEGWYADGIRTHLEFSKGENRLLPVR